MAAVEWCEKVRKRTAKNCQKQKAQKVRKQAKSAKMAENKRKQAKTCENDWGVFC